MMNKIMCAFIICFISVDLFSSENVDQINSYVAKIEVEQKELAQYLVLQTFTRFIMETKKNDQPMIEINSSDIVLSPDDISGLSKGTEDLLNILYSDSLDQKKIDSLTKLLIKMRRSRYLWNDLGFNLKSTYEIFFENFKMNTDVCSDEGFYQSMAVVENSAPQGIDFGKLKSAWNLQLGGNLSFDENGRSNFGTYAHLENNPQNHNAAEVRHAISTTSAYTLMLYVPPPWNTMAVVAVPALMETIWGAIDMQKNMQELDQLNSANLNLYQAQHLEVNVKKNYDNICKIFKKTYLLIRPLVLDIKNVSNWTA